MKNNSDDVVRQIFNNYLEQNNYRKTPERFAILDAVYSFRSYFSIIDLNDRLLQKNFPVSRATLYNTIKLLLKLRLVACHRLDGGTRYEACYANNHCTRICTVCGKVTDIKLPAIADAIERTHFTRFRKESFSMYVYGVCSSCQAALTRLKNKENINNKNKHLKENGKRQS